MNRYILHSDLNNFYASVECLCDPSLRNKAVVVVGDVEKRHGIVLAKNMLAKSVGVKTGDTVWETKIKCCGLPLVTVQADFAKYRHFSSRVRSIYNTFSDNVESFGIDEAWLDVSAICKSFKEAYEIAEMIRERVEEQVGITVSVGVSWNKIFAKLGSDLKKPNAVSVIDFDNYKTLVWDAPAGDLLMVGRATKTKLAKFNINTIGDIARSDMSFLKRLLGKNGEVLWMFANGLDASPVMRVNEFSTIKSIGNSVTCPVDLTSLEQVKSVIYTLSENVALRMRRENFFCKEVQISVKDNNLFSIERQRKLEYPTNLAKKISQNAIEIFERKYDFSCPVRALGVRVKDFSDRPAQVNLFEGESVNEKTENIEKTVEGLRGKYGYNIIKRAVVLGNEELSEIDLQSDEHVVHPEYYKIKS